MLIGLQQEMSEGDPLFLKVGFTCGFLNASGNFPEASDLWKSRANGSDVSKTVSFNNFTGIPSGPVDFFVPTAQQNEVHLESLALHFLMLCVRQKALVMSFGGWELVLEVGEGRALIVQQSVC